MEKENQQINKKDIQKLLNQQTDVILNAVDKKITKVDVKMTNVEVAMVNFEERLNKKIRRLDLNFSKKLDKLTTTLDNFLI